MFDQLMPSEDIECFASQLEHLGFAELTTYLKEDEDTFEQDFPQPARMDQVDATDRAA